MAPSEALRSKQLAMFIPAKDLMTASPHAGDLQRVQSKGAHTLETEDQLWERKLKESQNKHWNVSRGHKTLWEGQGLHESIAAEGVRTPVRILNHDDDNVTVLQGHHRIVAANDVDPEMLIPVVHYGEDEDMGRAMHSKDPFNINNGPKDKFSTINPKYSPDS
jgi:hypothetical protein